MSNAIDKHLIGLTGEYFVAGMMSLKGWVASLTASIVTNPQTTIYNIYSLTTTRIFFK